MVHPRTHEEKFLLPPSSQEKKNPIIANINGQNKQLEAT